MKKDTLNKAAQISFRELGRWAAYTESQEKSGITPLHQAAYDNDKQQLAALLHAKADPNMQDNNGWVPLHDAAMKGHTQIVSMLIQADADVNIQDKQYGYTPLHDAARKGHTDIIQLLLNAGARTDLRNLENHTPKECAEQYDQSAAAQLFPEQLP